MSLISKYCQIGVTVVCVTGVCVGRAAIAGSPGLLAQQEARVAHSVVKIRRRTTFYAAGREQHAINYGTGVIIGEERINGKREYILLSNEHVAHNHHVPGGGISTLDIIAGEGVHAPIRLELLSDDSKRDQALLRTIGCDVRFTFPEYAIGVRPERATLVGAFAEGYGGGKFGITEAKVISTEAEDWGIRCYRINASVGGGESGSPLIELGTDQRLYLVALVFCGTERYTDATPLDRRKGIFQRRSLNRDRSE
jgi:hypothetical protein